MHAAWRCPGTVLAVALCLAACASSRKELPAGEAPAAGEALDPHAQAAALGRGVNLGNELEATPEEGAWSGGLLIEESHLDLAKAAGFDSIRLPVGFAVHALDHEPYTIDAAFMDRVDEVVGWGLARGLRVVLDLHNYKAVMRDPAGERARFVALWSQIAARFRHAPDTLYYELLNEPNTGLDTRTWNRLVAQTLRAIRAVDPRHTVVVGATDWSNLGGLEGLEVPAGERNAVVTFHFYEPTLFCFQGKTAWTGSDWATTGITWPGPPATPVTPAPGVGAWARAWIERYDTVEPGRNPASEWAVEDAIARVAAWGAASGRPLWMGEFTAQDGADLASRARWIRAVRTRLEAHGIPWSFWSLASDRSSRLYDPSTGRWTTELTEALGLDVRN